MMSDLVVYDVVIVGGGLVGSSTALELSRRGLKTLVLEQFEPAGDRGSSHGDGRMIRYDYSEAIYVEMVRQAFAAWDELAVRSGTRLLAPTGSCNFGPDDSPQLAAIEDNFRRVGIPFERLSASKLNRKIPQFHLEHGSAAVFQANAGVLFASTAVKTIWNQAVSAGATCVRGERVDEIEHDGAYIHARSVSGQTWIGQTLVIAAGGWAGHWADRLKLQIPLTTTQEQLAYFAPKNGFDHSVGVMPNCIDYHTPHPFYCLPQVDVPGVKAGWHHTGEIIDPDDPRPIDESNLEAVNDFIQRRCPHLIPEPFKTTRCLYTNSPDYHFVLDKHPHLDRVVIATGFSGHGFKFGPVVAKMLAALVLDETPPVPLKQFSIDRFQKMDKLVPRTIA